MIIETELKLTITEQEIPKLINHPLLQQFCTSAPEKYPLYSTYFDTPDCLLLKAGYVLRIRHYKNTLVQTVKTANKSQLGLHQRQEYNQTIDSFKPDLDALLSLGLLKNINLDEIKQKIQAIFVTEMYRTAWQLEFANSKIELALDSGNIIAGTFSENISEIELELLEGDEKTLFDFADMLKKDIVLSAENQSKAERGYRLFLSVK